jgi:hypothetical protein
VTDTIAGHTYVFGRCDCFRHRADVNGAAREAISLGKTLIEEDAIAHVGRLTASEWAQILRDVAAEDAAHVNAMALL